MAALQIRAQHPKLPAPPGGRLLWLVLACITGLALGSAAATFTAELDRSVVPVGEPATLTLTVTGADPAQPPVLPNLPNLECTYVGPSRQVIVSNGRVSSTTRFTYTVVGRQPGEYIIPSLQVVAGGQTLTSAPIAFRVVRSDPRTQLAYLRLIVPQREIYVGEPFTVEVHLCLRDTVENIANVQMSSLPAESCTQLRQVRLPNRIERNEYGQFTVIPIVHALVPARAGILTLGPMDCSFVAELAPDGRQRRDPFSGLNFGLIRFTDTKPVSLSAEPQTLRVLPLPSEGAPPEFNGAVGQFTLSIQASPTNVAVGDPITVRVTIRGRGVWEALQLPDQPDWQAFKIYPPIAKVETTDPLGLEGSKTFELILAPQTTDLQALPPFRFAYFDPETRTYRRLATDPIPLTVRAGAATPMPTIATPRPGTETPPLPTRDILGLKQRLGPRATVGSPWIQQPAFWAVNSLPVLAWLCAWIWRRHQDTLTADPRRVRQRQARRRIRAALQELRHLSATGPADAFYATLFRLLQEQIGERLDQLPSAITEAVIEEKLRPAGLRPELAARLHQLFQLCNQARYAPGAATAPLPALYAETEEVLRLLQEFQP